MFTGRDLRTFRLAQGMTQAQLAKRIGLSQGVLSLLESGGLPVLHKHLTALSEQFRDPVEGPTFSDFQEQVSTQHSLGHAALFTPGTQKLMLTVWQWSPDFDLARHPPQETAVDQVLVNPTGSPMIALRMSGGGPAWEPDEMLVFSLVTRDELRDGELCLVQILGESAATTHIARVRVSGRGRGRKQEVHLFHPSGPAFRADDESLVSVLRLVYRGRYLAPQ